MWKPNTTNVGIIVQLIIYIFGKFNQFLFLLLLFSLLNSYFKCDYNDIFKDIFDKILIKTTRKNQQFSQSISISGCRIRNGNGSGFSIPKPDPRAKTCNPNPARLLNGFFSRARTRSCWAPRALSNQAKFGLRPNHGPIAINFFFKAQMPKIVLKQAQSA